MWRLAAVLLFLVGIFALWADLLRPVTAGAGDPGNTLISFPETEVILNDISPAPYDEFGYPAPIRHDTIFVGVPGDDDILNNAGAVRVFSRNEGGLGDWGLVTSITPDVVDDEAYFGRGLAVDGERLMVGARRESHPSYFNPGAAYIFEEDPQNPANWQQEARLLPSLLESNMDFGLAVDIAGDVAVAGAPNYGSPAYGAAFVFERDPVGGLWSETAALVDMVPDFAFLGWSVETDGNLILIGGPYRDIGGASSAGVVHVYARDPGPPAGWTFSGQLAAAIPDAGAQYGYSVALHPDIVVVGAPYYPRPAGGSGTVFVYERVGSDPQDWPLLTTIVPADVLNNMFGNSVSVNTQGDRIVVGAARDNSHAGAVYVFDRDLGGPGNWGQAVKLSGNQNFSLFGAGVDQDSSGLLTIGENWYGSQVGQMHLVCFHDDLEPNNDFGNAVSITAGQLVGLQICSGDEDFYAFDVPAGQVISTTIDFAHEAGNLDMALYGPDFSLLAESTSLDDGEMISHPSTESGTYYLQVYGVDLAANRYDLALDWQPPPCSDDDYEENDDFASAADIPFGVITDLTICPADEDYYRVEVPAGVVLSVGITFTHDLGDLNLALYDADQTLVMESTSTTDNETVSLVVPAGGRYFIHVYGVGLATNQYDLAVRMEAFNYLPIILNKP